MNIFRNDTDKNVVCVAAGTYLLCDPCYCFNNDTKTWAALVDSIFDISSESEYIAYAGDIFITCAGTSNGDGSYKIHSNSVNYAGKVIDVDSGLIGLVPIDFIEKGSYADTHGIGVKLTFDRGFVIVYDEGKFEIISSKEHLVIDTNYEDDDYEETEECDE